MGFAFSEPSRKKLEDVNPALKAVMELALALSTIDFGIVQGRRTDAQEWQLVQEGKSRTVNSRHLTGDAVDVDAFVGGKVSWDAVHYPRIAWSVALASQRLRTPIRWGGTWSVLPSYPAAEELDAAYKAYAAAFKRRTGRDALVDLGHFEIPR